MQIQVCRARGEGTDTTVCNFYWSPSSSSRRDPEDLETFLDILATIVEDHSPAVIAGDLNGHHPTWDSSHTSDRRGAAIHDWLVATGRHSVANNPSSHTRAQSRSLPNGERPLSQTSPDVTFVTTSCVPNLKATFHSADTRCHGVSDHAVLSYETCERRLPSSRLPSTWWKIKKANCSGEIAWMLRDARGKRLELPRDAARAEQILQEAIAVASPGRLLGRPPAHSQ